MFEFIFSENTFFGFCIGIILILSIALLHAFITSTPSHEETHRDKKTDIVVTDVECDIVTENLFETECPFVEGTISAEAWHKRTGR